MMTEEIQEHLDSFRSAVDNNQLYLAIQHLREVVDPLVEKVFDDNVVEPDAEEETAAPQTSGKKSSAKSSPPTKKSPAKTKKASEEE